jgi:RNA polymerase sigma factor (sigma-70 family)
MNQQNARTAVGDFLSAERNRLVSYVRRLIDDTAERDGEDIVQDVALSLFDRADVLMPIEAVSAYVYRSLRHRVIDHLRRRRDIVSLDRPLDDEGGSSLLDHLSGAVPDGEEEATRSELRRRIYEAIEGLSAEQKAVVIETELNGRSFRDLSGEWGIPVGTLLARKSRALARVRESLQEFKP